VPVGVILSDQEGGRIWFRLPHAEEEIEGVSLPAAMPYLDMARVQIEAWARHGTLPYACESLPPLSAEWWGQVRRLMQWRVRLDPALPIDCHAPEAELELLYGALVRPLLVVSGAMGQLEAAAPTAAAD